MCAEYHGAYLFTLLEMFYGNCRYYCYFNRYTIEANFHPAKEYNLGNYFNVSNDNRW